MHLFVVVVFDLFNSMIVVWNIEALFYVREFHFCDSIRISNMSSTVCQHHMFRFLFFHDCCGCHRSHLTVGDTVSLHNIHSMVIDNTRVWLCNVRSNITILSCVESRPRLFMEAGTVIPYGVLSLLPLSLLLMLSKCDYDLRRLDEKSYSSFMEVVLLWKYNNGCKQVHPLLRFFKNGFSSSASQSKERPFESALFKSVDQLASVTRVMAFNDKRKWTRGLLLFECSWYLIVLFVCNKQ